MKRAFVIMPFSRHLTWVYKEIIKPACAQAGYSVERADELFHQRTVMRDVTEGILLSNVVIADLTDSNPNVFYELGIAHSLLRPVVIMTQDVASLPFDVKSHRVLVYNRSARTREQSIELLRTTLTHTASYDIEVSNPVADHMPRPFRYRIIQANRHVKPVGSLRLFSKGRTAVVKGKGFLSHGTVIEPSYDIRSVHWGSRESGWGWDGKDHHTCNVYPRNGVSSFEIRDIVPTSMGDIRGTPYIRTIHDELIYFDLYLWNIVPSRAFQKTENEGAYSGILEIPLKSLPKEK